MRTVRRHRYRARIRTVGRALGPMIMLLAILAMPISYRAGTDDAHPHTIYQGIIDAVFGPHHHHDDEPGAVSNSAAAFVAASVPLGAVTASNDVAAPATAPDIPTQLGLSSPIDATASILMLGALIALLLDGRGRRPDADRRGIPRGSIPALDPPPPRLVS